MRARPLPLSVASVLLALLSLANLLSPAMPSEGVPAFVIYLVHDQATFCGTVRCS
jgi:hypothetical protein